MLAVGFDIEKVTYPCYVQPKLDGVRSFSFLNEKLDVEFLSRNGKRFSLLNHLQISVREFIYLISIDKGWDPRKLKLDGEIYSHNLTFQELISAVKKNSENTQKLEFHIFDFVYMDYPEMPFSEKEKILKNYFLKFKNEIPFKLVDTYFVQDFAEIQKYQEKFLNEKYEGLMVRLSNNFYQFDTRSKSLMKFKKFFDADFEIIEVKEATGRDSGTAVFQLKNENGDVFNARPMGTQETRANYLKNSQNLIGKFATVVYQELTDRGVPRFPVVKCIRNYE
jgi:DNA ligase-1